MESACGGTKPYMNSNSLDEEHLISKDKAMEQFMIKRKMGGDEFSESYKLKLETVSHHFIYIYIIICDQFLILNITYVYIFL